MPTTAPPYRVRDLDRLFPLSFQATDFITWHLDGFTYMFPGSHIVISIPLMLCRPHLQRTNLVSRSPYPLFHKVPRPKSTLHDHMSSTHASRGGEQSATSLSPRRMCCTLKSTHTQTRIFSSPLDTSKALLEPSAATTLGSIGRRRSSILSKAVYLLNLVKYRRLCDSRRIQLRLDSHSTTL